MKIDLPKRNILFQAGIFRAYLTFMECIFHVLLLIFVWPFVVRGKKRTSHFYFHLPCSNSEIHRFSFIPFKNKKVHVACLQISYLTWTNRVVLLYIFKWRRISLEGFPSWFTKFWWLRISPDEWKNRSAATLRGESVATQKPFWPFSPLG